MSKSRDLANAVKDEMANLAPPVTAQALKISEFKPEDLDTLQVVVNAATVRYEQAGRAGVLPVYGVLVGVTQNVDKADEDAVDTLQSLAERIAEEMSGRSLGTLGAASWIETEIALLYDPDLLDRGVFQTTVQLDYRVLA